MLYMCTMCRRC